MRRISIAIGASLLAVSLAYNLVWITFANDIAEMDCLAHLTIVRSDAYRAEAKGDWLAASQNYAHLLRYGADSPFGCHSPFWDGTTLLLPLAAYGAVSSERATPAQALERDLADVRERYVHSFRRALDPNGEVASIQPKLDATAP